MAAIRVAPVHRPRRRPRIPRRREGGSRIVLKDTESADSLEWQWTGDGFEQADLGDPTTFDTYYSLCIYDETASVAVLAAELGINRGEDCRGMPDAMRRHRRHRPCASLTESASSTDRRARCHGAHALTSAASSLLAVMLRNDSDHTVSLRPPRSAALRFLGGSTISTRTHRPERTQTDDSLAVERAKSDDALAEASAAERRADIIVAGARETADEVLSSARARADDVEGSDEAAIGVVERLRRHEDQAIEAERDAADAALRAERTANARLLASLLPIERDKTDKHLLTERARSDQDLTARDDFLGMVSHDLRDLLAGIVLNAALIAEQDTRGAAATGTAAAASRIQRSAARMSRLIGDLVDVAAIDAGKLAIVTTTTSACDIVTEAIDIWRPAADARGVALEPDVDPDAEVGMALDRERVLQVLGNLITNAVKFSSPGAVVGVGVEGKDGAMRFRVRDTGVGIAAEARESIFERFWQAGHNDRRGIGLGLYISRCVVEAHGGRIWVESEPGTGSTFFFTIPCGSTA